MARRTREIWRNLIGQFERSGKTIEQFAGERQIPSGTLKTWIYRLRKEKAEEAAEILPVRVISSASPPAAWRHEESQAGAVEVMLVRFASGTDSELIAEVVSRLRRC
jgi:hypothetical protein